MPEVYQALKQQVVMKLRDYQQCALEAISKSYDSGITRQMVVLPTGAGKTVIMGHAIKAREGRAIFLAHRLELITQAAHSIKNIVGDSRSVATSSGYIGDDRIDDPLQADIFIGTIQSCGKKFIEKLLSYGDIDTMVIDEAHHSSAPSYRKAIQRILKLDDKFNFKESKKSLLIGCTATPARSDGVTIKGIFQEIVYRVSIKDLMDLGYLANVDARVVMMPIQGERVFRTRCGDFVDADLAQLNTVPRNKIIVDAYKRLAGDKKAIAFCLSVDHSEKLANMFVDNGIKAEAVHGKMPKSERNGVLARLKSGETQVVTSRDVLIEGFDEPSISCVLMCRPTKSRTVYTQCIGRGLRTYQNKEYCMVIDFCEMGHSLRTACHMGMIDFFFLVSLSVLCCILRAMLYRLGVIIGLIREKQLKEKTVSLGGGKRPQNIVSRRVGEREVSIIDNNNLLWIYFDGTLISPSNDFKAKIQGIVVELCEGGYKVKLAEKVPSEGIANYIFIDMHKDIMDYDQAIDLAEDIAELKVKNNRIMVSHTKDTTTALSSTTSSLKFMGATPECSKGDIVKLRANYNAKKIYSCLKDEPPTPNQLFFLKKDKVVAKTKRQACVLINEIKNGR